MMQVKQISNYISDSIPSPYLIFLTPNLKFFSYLGRDVPNKLKIVCNHFNAH